jgi:hypothetical protein
VDSGRGQTDEDVAGLDIGCRQDQIPFDGTDGETGQVVVVCAGSAMAKLKLVRLTRMVHSRHLGSLSSNQRTSSLQTTLGDALDDIRGNRHVQLGARKVVEEVERLGTLDNQVVDAHRHEINTDGRMLADIERDSKLGSNTVRTGDQNGIPEPSALEVECTSESSNLAVGSWSTSGFDDGLDGVDEGVAVVYRDTGRGIS